MVTVYRIAPLSSCHQTANRSETRERTGWSPGRSRLPLDKILWRERSGATSPRAICKFHYI